MHPYSSVTKTLVPAPYSVGKGVGAGRGAPCPVEEVADRGCLSPRDKCWNLVAWCLYSERAST